VTLLPCWTVVKWHVRAGVIAVAGMLAGACGLPTSGENDLVEGGSEASSDPVLDAAEAPESTVSGFDGGPIADAVTGMDVMKATADAATMDVTTKDAPEDVAAKDAGVKDVGPVDVSPPPVAEVVQSTGNDNQNTSSLATGVAPIGAGHLVVVLVAYDDTDQSVTSITDGTSNQYVTANLRSSASGCQASEMWYARNTASGATSVTVNTSGSVHLSIWILEVSGLASSGMLDAYNVTNDAPQSTTVNVPAVTPTGVPAFVVAAVGSCGTIGNVNSPFTGLAVEHGNGGAYDIATTIGAYGPVFANQNDSWNASIADFR
jgi:hypothetical protein